MAKKVIVDRLIWPANEDRKKEMIVPDDKELEMFDHKRKGPSSFEVIAQAIKTKEAMEKKERDCNERVAKAVRENR